MSDKPLSKAAQAKALKSAIAHADRWYNKWIVLRDKKCILCGSEDIGQCSHFYGKTECPTLRYERDNTHRMCRACHTRHHKREYQIYAYWMRKHVPEKRLDELHELSLSKELFPIEYYESIEAKYKTMVQALLTKNGKV
jgi:hypothetical protein